MKLAIALLAVLCGVAACAPKPAQPTAFDAAHEACAFCRMTGSDGRAAAQLVTPGEEPLFFDDIGCLSDYVNQHGRKENAVAFVTDYDTRAWVRADVAAFVRQPSIDTPMGSHLLAFASPSSRDAAAAAKGGTPVGVNDILKR